MAHPLASMQLVCPVNGKFVCQQTASAVSDFPMAHANFYATSALGCSVAGGAQHVCDFIDYYYYYFVVAQ